MNGLRWLIPVVLLLTACGGTDTAPTPLAAPAPPPPVVAADPARFDAGFNAQLVHDAFDHPDAQQPPRLLRNSPSIYMQTAGMDAALVARYEQEARAVVPALTGGRLSVATFETGASARPLQAGWIMVEQINEPDGAACGRAEVGLAAGHIWLNVADRCTFGTGRTDPITLGHELGHALGFYHVADSSALMFRQRVFGTVPMPNDKEQYHASLAYQSNGAYAEGGSFSTQRIILD